MDGKTQFLSEVSSELRSQELKLREEAQKSGCLVIKEANQWVEEAKNRPIPNMLFSEFWYENELCILFADTNIGKSILAVQIADSLSKGRPITGFKNECTPMKILYLDFELSDKQFENRCSENYCNHYSFNRNFLRAEMNQEVEIPKQFKGVEDYLSSILEGIIINNGFQAVIVDNLTFLKTDNEKAKDALQLMKLLNKIKKKTAVSILVLAHTPKRDEAKPITQNDVSGSKMLMNFCDSSFAIGRSSLNPTLRFVKQIKQRNTEHVYHSENVALCQLNKASNFLCFEFIGFSTEGEHLKQTNFNSLSERDEEMEELIKEGLSNVKIAEKLGLSEGAIRKRRKVLGI